MRKTMLAVAICLSAAFQADAAGFRQITIADPGNPPIQANLWYPSAVPPKLEPIGLLSQVVAEDAPVGGTHLGLIVISHGTGGNRSDHLDTARALANAGFVVIAPTHTGDNWKDLSRVLQIWDRPRQLHRVLDYMLQDWPEHTRIDPVRVGAFGFSAGGFTVLVAAGATPDMSRIAPHCHDNPNDWTCHYVAAHQTANEPPAPPPSAWVHDPRIHAAVVAAPALGYTFGKQGLAGIHIPVQLWRAGDDQILPQPYYAQAVADDLSPAPEYHVVPGAGHLDFLVPCSPALAKVAPAICTSAVGFDRIKFHQQFNLAVVRFFQEHLSK
jgi:predicted dienelactone hydrolase